MCRFVLCINVMHETECHVVCDTAVCIGHSLICLNPFLESLLYKQQIDFIRMNQQQMFKESTALTFAVI